MSPYVEFPCPETAIVNPVESGAVLPANDTERELPVSFRLNVAVGFPENACG